MGITRKREVASDLQVQVSRSLLLPSRGAFVTVDIGDHRLRCLVEEVYADRMQVALPGGGFLIDDAATVVVEWPNGQGVTEMTARAETVGLGRWVLRAVEGVQSVQRRAFVRITAPVRVQIKADDGALLHLRTSDLSEGGARVCFPRETAPQLSVGARMRVSVMCGNQPVRMAAEVLRVRDAGEAGLDVALRFVGSYPADILRRWVLDRQVAHRRRRRA